MVIPTILREEVGTGHLEHLHRSWDALKARPGTSQNHHFCLHLGISSSFFFSSLCFSIVSVEKVELKGLAHKKNERNVEYSFEVSLGFLSCERRIVLREELRKCSNFIDCLSQKSRAPLGVIVFNQTLLGGDWQKKKIEKSLFNAGNFGSVYLGGNMIPHSEDGYPYL